MKDLKIEDLPASDKLLDAGIDTIEKLVELNNDFSSVNGVGKKTGEKIMAALNASQKGQYGPEESYAPGAPGVNKNFMETNEFKEELRINEIRMGKRPY